MPLHRSTRLLFTAALILPLAACGAYRGAWPQLAPRDDAEARFQREGVADIEPTAAFSPPPRETLPALDPDVAEERRAGIVASLDQERLTLSSLDRRYEDQRKRVEEARRTLSMNRFGPSSTSWTTTQLELTRLNQVATDIEAVRNAVARLAAEVAVLAARQVDIAPLLSDVGTLIARIDTRLAAAEIYRREVALSLSNAPGFRP
jgi:hypothetical protein